MPSTPTDFQVLMLGPRAAGKTTLLATMWDHIDSQLDGSIATLRCDIATSQYFSNASTALKQMFRSPGLTVAAGIEGTATSTRKLLLELCTPGHVNPHLRLHFLDYSGGLIGSPGEIPEDLETQMQTADCCFVVIDTPALVEENGRFHLSRNLPDHITNLLRQRLEQRQLGPLHVVLIATKAEKYLQLGMEEEVVQLIQTEYARLLQLVEQHRCPTDIGLVETLGTIVFTEFEVRQTADGQEFPIYHYRKLSPDAVHTPRNVTYPLQVILRNAVGQSIVRRRQANEGFNWLHDLFDRDVELNQVSEHLLQVAQREAALTSRSCTPAAVA